MAKSKGYYVEEVAAALRVGLDEGKELAFGMDDGDIDLGRAFTGANRKEYRS